ncbi:hypothetical protein HU675_0034735 [Bradyrhizobium septentrionale]|uniref:hypothetical protein n=1 Tax=Bradyrhizobium septentrionale TaxID=1404411 RepID=UPI001596C7CF|nr:hypothetical protein [Bradyrhizobium septentrionale]UGY23076.1 hypothetical protein HU675_0034735 [Bradyrhizobium septentrionale]
MTTDKTPELEIKLSPNGEFVVLRSTTDNCTPVALNIPTDIIGEVVVGLLGAAAACSSAPPPIGAGQTPELPYVMAGGFALSDISDRPDAFALTFGFGQTLLSIGLSRKALGHLGKGMMAASADSSTKPS